jgi:hypothetical protein
VGTFCRRGYIIAPSNQGKHRRECRHQRIWLASGRRRKSRHRQLSCLGFPPFVFIGAYIEPS